MLHNRQVPLWGASKAGGKLIFPSRLFCMLTTNKRLTKVEAEPTSQIVFHDAEILRIAGNLPAPIISLFDKYRLPSPSVTAVYQWVSRKNIPDKWRAALIYALMSEGRISVNQIFCRTSKQNP